MNVVNGYKFYYLIDLFFAPESNIVEITYW